MASSLQSLLLMTHRSAVYLTDNENYHVADDGFIRKGWRSTPKKSRSVKSRQRANFHLKTSVGRRFSELIKKHKQV
jgi:hypothetical protein